MSSRIHPAFVAIAACLLAGWPGAARATFHDMQIEQVIAGVNGNTAVQAIQLRMSSGSQNFVQQARIRAHDAAGLNPFLVHNMNTMVPNGTTGARVLLATANFTSFTSPPVTPDFIITTPIPLSYLAAGSLTFEQDTGTIYWRLSWGGPGYTGSGAGNIFNDSNGNFNPPFPGPLQSATLQAVQFRFAATANSTDNNNDYQLTAGAAVFTNNAGASGIIINPVGACCLADGICVIALGEGDCASMSGDFRGPGTTCADGDSDMIPDVLETNDCSLPHVQEDLCSTRTNPGSPDTDGDGYLDGDEAYSLGTNPCVPDTDCNSNELPDAAELARGSRQDRNGNQILDICEYGECTVDDGDTNGDGFVDGLDIQEWVDCYLGSVTNCACVDVDGDTLITQADIPTFAEVLVAPNPLPRCDNCHALVTTVWECHHWADDANGAACSTTLCIENTIDTATCDFHPTRRGPRQCNTRATAPPKVVQRVHMSSCPGGVVAWVLGFDLTWGCTGCFDNSLYVSCVVSPCSANLVRGPFNRLTRHQCGCP